MGARGGSVSVASSLGGYKIVSLVLAAIVAFTCCVPAGGFAREASAGEPATILAIPKSDTSASEVFESVSEVDGEVPVPVDLTENPLLSGKGGRIAVVETKASARDEVVDELAASGLYQSVDYEHEYVPLYPANAATGAVPNDPQYQTNGGSWGLKGGWGANFQAVWYRLGDAAASRSDAFPVAVIDTGFNFEHEDSGNAIVPGWNYGTESSAGASDVSNFEPGSKISVTSANHGTATAGIIGAQTDNGKGVASATWDGKVTIYKVLDVNGVISTRYLVRAINRAVTDGAKVINISLGTEREDLNVSYAIANARTKGVIVVAASGNSATASAAGPVIYPAADPNVISVGAINSSGFRSSFSTYNDALDVVAPGEGVICLTNQGSSNDSYATARGTSFAAPYVTAGCAVLRRRFPGLTPTQIESIIKLSARDVTATGVGWDPQTGWGALNMPAAYALAEKTQSDPAALSSRVALSASRLEFVYGSGTNAVQLAAVAEGPATGGTIKWISSNTSVVRVSTSGIVSVAGTGRASVTALTANGRSATCVVTVRPKKLARPAAKSTARKKAKVTWKATSARGYQVQVARNKGFTKGRKIYTVRGGSARTKTIGTLASRKTYYVRVRAYTASGSTRFYGAWSSIKAVRVK